MPSLGPTPAAVISVTLKAVANNVPERAYTERINPPSMRRLWPVM